MNAITTTAEFQRFLEVETLSAGVERYRTNQDKKAIREGLENRDDAKRVIRDAIPIVSTAITAWVAEAAKPKKGRPALALAPLKKVDADVVALLALSVIFNRQQKNPSVTGIAFAIGKMIHIELEALAIRDIDAKAAAGFRKKISGEGRAWVNEARHDRLTEELGVSIEADGPTNVLIGGTVLNLVLTALPDTFTRDIVKDRRGTTPVIVLTEEALAAMAEITEALAWTRPPFKPMVEQPRQWERFDSGCYFDFKLSRQVPLVRTHSREHKRYIIDAIKSGAMDECLEGLNAIQDTRFAIDERVLAVIQWAFETGKRPHKSFPASKAPEVPEKVAPQEWAALDAAARSAKSRRRKTLSDHRQSFTVDAQGFAGDIATAEMLTSVHAFYLPHNMDFRGRVYAVPHFNPQRSDHIKALFHFADAVPMGPDGGDWLMIHLANCYDAKIDDTGGPKVSKLPFPERIQWVKDNAGAILEVAADPTGTFDFWGEADSPFCFLQACFEYSDWAMGGYRETHPSTIAIALDGSCSGLQHYSAMTRSKEEGYHVNLLPREDVGDIYRVVAAAARPALVATAAGGCRASQIILEQGFGRGEVKRNVMTYFYGSGRFGMRDQHMVDTMRPLADKVALGERGEHPYALERETTNNETGETYMVLDGGFKCADILAKHVHAAVVRVAPKADEASLYFQGVAATLAHESLPVVWSTPVGLPVVQRYSEYENKTVNLWLYDRSVLVPATHTDKVDGEGKVLTRIQAHVETAPTKRINKRKARSAISPNVVHSLDAAHLVRTVVRAKAEGITHFQLIHDSFGTHAGNTTKMARVIREAFVSCYTTYDPFEVLDTAARAVLSVEGQEKLPAIPAKGDLDLEAIKLAFYAFA